MLLNHGVLALGMASCFYIHTVSFRRYLWALCQTFRLPGGVAKPFRGLEAWLHSSWTAIRDSAQDA